MKRIILGVFLLCVFTGCHIYGPHIPPMPLASQDNNCEGACQHLRDLGCEEGFPLEDGTTCEAFCKETQDAGHILRPSCVMTLTSCDDVEMEKCQTPRTIFGN